ncbi:hypothetical protein SteCoe_36633 [Stentor coeruleus]|uniref:DUF4201 domain-containing protein n=1 Tax=Stentor coeruleus TaxID=5963 RepID=A0A1R2APS8_9CILI|nr:hypothetical protein SteCoe_36633 [Stentor coeruleus]
MKQTENSIEYLNVSRKFTKTPSTICSFSASPAPTQIPEEEILLKNLEEMQTKLAEYLKRQSEFIVMQIPLLHHRWHLMHIRHIKVKKTKNLIGKMLKKISESLDIKKMYKRVQLQEEKNEQMKEDTYRIKNELKCLRKKHKDVLDYETKNTYIKDECLTYNKDLDCLKQQKSIHQQTLADIHKMREKTYSLYIPIKKRLEEIMISKEELLLTIPQLGFFPQSLEAQKEKIGQIEISNTELKGIVRQLSGKLEVQQSKNRKKSNVLKEQVKRFECQLALMRVQERFLQDKRSKYYNAKNT